MKIGIITHHYINNFGAFLQAYALQKALAEKFPGNEIYIIDDVNIKHFIINTGGWFRFYRKKETISCWLQKIKLPYRFFLARKSYMNLSKRCYGAKDVNALDLDCIIFGSDEIWNYEESKGNAKIKFGDGIICSNLISYAPSVGNSGSKDLPEYVKSGIARFSFVSARDELTQKMAQFIRGSHVERVLDPTFLTKIPSEPVAGIKKPYILFYYCDGLSESEKDQLFIFAKEKGLYVYGAGECDKRYSDITVDLIPFQWVWMFQNASYVITGTFHGVVFSLLNKRQFACYLTNESRKKKVGSLLVEFGLESRQASGNADDILEVMQREIDFAAVEAITEKKRASSLQFLTESISNIKVR